MSERCSFDDCESRGTIWAAGRRHFSGEAKLYCESHAQIVSDDGSPEYTAGCPNCGCLFGVN